MTKSSSCGFSHMNSTMTRIKLCGLCRIADIQGANACRPDYIGFVFASKSSRYVTFEQAVGFKRLLHPGIQAVGVFVNENPKTVARLLNEQVIDLAQLHGNETEKDILRIRDLTDRPLIQAFSVKAEEDIGRAQESTADFLLLDSGEGGTGKAFPWELVRHIQRPYFLAGGLGPENVAEAIRLLRPYAVDVSSGIETDGRKDSKKMAAFVEAARKIDGKW